MNFVQEESAVVTEQPRRADTLQEAKRRVPINVLANWLSFIATFAVTFLISPLLVHRLGSLEYGIWTLIGDIVGYSWILGMGVGLAVSRYGAGYFALSDKQKFNGLVTTSLLINAASSAILLAGGVWIAYVFPHLFAVPPHLVFAARVSLVMIVVGASTSFPGSTFSGCLVSFSRYDWIAIRTTSATVLRALLLWYFLEHGYGLVAVACISMLTNIVSVFIEAGFVKYELPELKIAPRYFDRSMLKPLIEFSSYGFLLSVAARLVYMTDTLVIGFVLGPAAVTYYAIGAKLPLMLRDSLGNITNLYFPFASQMHALGKEDSLRKLFIAGSRIASLYIFPGVAGLVIVGPPFLEIWMGKSFGPLSGPIVVILAFEAIFFGASTSAGYVLFGMGRHNLNAWISLANAGVNLILSVTLIRWMGPMGVAWGTLIPAVITQGIVLPFYTARILNASLKDFYLAAFLRPLLAVAPMSALLLAARYFGQFEDYPRLFLSVFVSCVVYAICAWTLVTDSEERAHACRVFTKYSAMLRFAR